MKLNLNLFFQFFLFLLTLIYFSQGSFYPSGSILAKLALLLIMVISSFYLIKLMLLKFGKNIFFYTWTFFLFVNVLGFLFGGKFNDIYYSQFRNILSAILPFFPFYYFSIKGDVSRKNLLCFFMGLIVVGVVNFYSNRNNLLAESLDENVVSNVAYFFVALLPFIFLWGKNKVLSIISSLLIIFFIIQGAKRGALFTGLVGMLVFIYYQITLMNPKERFKNLIYIILGFSSIVLFSYYFYISNEYLVSRVTEISENSSNRDVIYKNLWNNWYNSENLINIVFGFGFVSSIIYSGNGFLAHNDWLELLTNFGLLGVFSYLAVILSLVFFIVFSNSQKEIKIILSCILLMWVLKTLFSMYYTVSTTMISSMLIGYLLGISNRKKY